MAILSTSRGQRHYHSVTRLPKRETAKPVAPEPKAEASPAPVVPTRVERTAEPADKPRTVVGRYASPSCPWAITQVLLPNWQWGYRVGDNGRIYASKEAAERFARTRQNRLVAAN